jgi:hypothetical protein
MLGVMAYSGRLERVKNAHQEGQEASRWHPRHPTPPADRNAQRARPGKLSAAERSAFNQALAKALAFRDAGKMPKAREWAAELVRLLRSHNLLT